MEGVDATPANQEEHTMSDETTEAEDTEGNRHVALVSDAGEDTEGNSRAKVGVTDTGEDDTEGNLSKRFT
ncbi:MAG: hypothetical protein JO291_13995 [Acidimicrobiia bacterium]|nr:hypothetical protein [Acidimicrobiia bacterium]